jgi:hypothetical protein
VHIAIANLGNRLDLQGNSACKRREEIGNCRSGQKAQEVLAHLFLLTVSRSRFR